MSKLISKFQSPWTPINYKSPENFEPKSTKYSTKNTPTILDVQDEQTKQKHAQMSGIRHMLDISQKEPVSGIDPVGEFIVAGEVLGGLNPLGKILFPYAARFTSGPVRNWIASKALNDVLAKDALIGGVNKVVQNNGNILLRLASHSARKPRQLRIEPQGNNSFRVHASTWGGLTNTEKKQLYESLYKELPENAKILFPESNPNYLATRGTVSSLLKLKRDSRFTPGSTIQKLMYKDKDGSIKFFEGTSFTKNSELQPKTISNNYTDTKVNKPKTSLAFFEKLLANINKNNLKTSSYNYKNIGNKDIVSQFFNNLKIQGKTVSVDGNVNNYSSRKLGENAKNNLIHNTIERNIDEMRNLGYSENEINLYRQKAIDELNNVRVGHYTAEDYSKANMGESGGFYNPDDNFISVNTESKFPVDFIEAHEGRHMLDFKTSTMPHQDILLSDAYDNDFINIPNTKYAGSIKGYQNMNRERITTNRDTRETLLKGFNKESRHIQNLVIDKSSDDQIFKAVENANGYGRRYIQFLRDNNALTHQKAQQFREAMKHVGVITGISFGIANQNKQ